MVSRRRRGWLSKRPMQFAHAAMSSTADLVRGVKRLATLRRHGLGSAARLNPEVAVSFRQAFSAESRERRPHAIHLESGVLDYFRRADSMIVSRDQPLNGRPDRAERRAVAEFILPDLRVRQSAQRDVERDIIPLQGGEQVSPHLRAARLEGFFQAHTQILSGQRQDFLNDIIAHVPFLF